MNNGTLYVNGRASTQTTRAGVSDPYPPFGRADIFISHQREDLNKAQQLAIQLSKDGHSCYLDEFDQQVDGDSPDLEGYLRRIIGNTQALLAVVSRNTATSWWVPLEIGVALDREKHIGTFLVETVSLPSYLWQWPVMQRETEALRWARHTKRSTPAGYHRLWRNLPYQTGLSYRSKSVDIISV